MSKKLLKKTQQRVQQTLYLLKRYYRSAQCALFHENPFQLLVATILSAQCTDKRVNALTKNLFKKYPLPADFAGADLKELEKDIYSTGFFRSKARNIQGSAQKIQKDFQGKMPKNLPALLSLPGVGRKTAHVVLGTAFGISSGVVVDTHVRRLSLRLGFTSSKDPTKIEQDLGRLIPKKDWIYFSHALILHGREVCKARVPLCHTCFLEELCPYPRKKIKKIS